MDLAIKGKHKILLKELTTTEKEDKEKNEYSRVLTTESNPYTKRAHDVNMMSY